MSEAREGTKDFEAGIKGEMAGTASLVSPEPHVPSRVPMFSLDTVMVGEIVEPVTRSLGLKP